MELERHGLKVVLRKTDNFLPGDGSYLLSGRDGLTRSEIARHVPADGAAYDRYHEELDTVVPLIRNGCSRRRRGGRRHPRPSSWPASAATRSACRPTKSGSSTSSRPRARATSSTASSRRSDQGAVRVRRHRRQFRLALHAGHGLRPAPPSVRRGRGRSGRLGPCDRRHGRDHPGDGQGLPRGGVDIVLNAPVSEIIVEKGRASGVVAGGKSWRAPTVVAGSIPSCFVRPAGAQGRGQPQVEEHFAHWGCESATFRMNVALDKLPNFTVAAGPRRSFDRRHHHGAEHGLYAPRLADAALNGWSSSR